MKTYIGTFDNIEIHLDPSKPLQQAIIGLVRFQQDEIERLKANEFQPIMDRIKSKERG